MNPKIVVVDDDFDNRAIVQEVLTGAGYQVFQGTNGEEALEVVAAQKPAVLLLDLSMPKLNGWETAKRIRQDPAFSSMAIIAFTAHALVGDELRAKASGCDDYISKPCLPKDVLAKVVFWLEKQNKAAA